MLFAFTLGFTFSPLLPSLALRASVAHLLRRAILATRSVPATAFPRGAWKRGSRKKPLLDTRAALGKDKHALNFGLFGAAEKLIPHGTLSAKLRKRLIKC